MVANLLESANAEKFALELKIGMLPNDRRGRTAHDAADCWAECRSECCLELCIRNAVRRRVAGELQKNGRTLARLLGTTGALLNWFELVFMPAEPAGIFTWPHTVHVR